MNNVDIHMDLEKKKRENENISENDLINRLKNDWSDEYNKLIKDNNFS